MKPPKTALPQDVGAHGHAPLRAGSLPPPLEEVVGPAVFKAEVAAWAKRIGVHPKEIRLRPMTRKWASCSSHGRLTFNSEILRQPARFRVEAIVHELLHMKVPHHGKLFRALLRSYLGCTGEVQLGPVI